MCSLLCACFVSKTAQRQDWLLSWNRDKCSTFEAGWGLELFSTEGAAAQTLFPDSCCQSLQMGCDFVGNNSGHCFKCSVHRHCSSNVIRHSSPPVLNVRAVVSCLEEIIHIERGRFNQVQSIIFWVVWNSKGPGAIQRWNENQETLPVVSVALKPKAHSFNWVLNLVRLHFARWRVQPGDLLLACEPEVRASQVFQGTVSESVIKHSIITRWSPYAFWNASKMYTECGVELRISRKQLIFI